ncbi:hypothetical protein HAV_00024 [Candidatus Hepatincola sp. Av]
MTKNKKLTTTAINNAIDNSSTSTDATIRLLIEDTNITDLYTGFTLLFRAPFTLSAQEIINNLSYEKIELTLSNGTMYSHLVKRAPYTPASAGLYEDDIKDNRPSFIQGSDYYIMFNGYEWVTADGNVSGAIIAFSNNDYTPAGYQDIAYNYGTIDFNSYPFLRVYDPCLNNTDFAMSKTNLAMMPEHTHTWQANYHEKAGSSGDCADNVTYSTETSGVNSLNAEKVQLGDELYPSHVCIRFLERIL